MHLQLKSIVYSLFTSMLFIASQGFSQEKQDKLLFNYQLGTQVSTSGKVPFWLRSNQYGSVPNQSNFVYFNASMHTQLKPNTAKKFRSFVGADLVGVIGKSQSIVIPEAYIGAHYKKFTAFIGRKKQIHGLVDSTLSSGSITWSGNALPLPEIQISIPTYTKLFIPFLSFKGHFSHGWFGNQPQVRNYFLHQKSLYGRLGKPNSKIKLYAGLLHNAQWGGKPKYNDPVNQIAIDGKFATGWYTYWNIVFPFNNPRADSSIATYDSENRFGNHLGQFDLGGDITGKNMKLMIYKQIIFETGQTFSSLTNIDDGLYGISLSNLKPNSGVNRVVLEFLHTTNQGLYRSGLLRLIGFYGKHFGRNQNFYFNHGQYRDGWSYQGASIGSPFMIPNELIRSEKRVESQQLFANNNNIKALYLGLNNNFGAIKVETKISYSRNFGSYNIKITPSDQLSFAMKTVVPTKNKKGTINVSIGIEQGDLIADNYGANISYTRTWN